MVTEAQIEAVLRRLRPALQADGGDIQLVGVYGNSARVRLTGACATCPTAHVTLYLGVETAMQMGKGLDRAARESLFSIERR